MTLKKLEATIRSFKHEVASKFTELNENLQSTSNSIKDDISAVRDVLVTNLVKKNKELHLKSCLLEGRVIDLEDRLAKTEKRLNQIEQNHRKSNLEIDGIPADVSDEHLKGAVVQIINHIVDEEVTVGDVEACHRLQSKTEPKPTIVRMRRNIVDEAKFKSKNLRDVDVAVNLPPGTQVYVKDNQSPSMRMLSYNARLLKTNKLIQDTWFSNAFVRIKHNDKTYKISHEMDLVKLFPNFAGFNFDKGFCERVLFENPDVRDMLKMDALDGAWVDFAGPELAAVVEDEVEP